MGKMKNKEYRKCISQRIKYFENELSKYDEMYQAIKHCNIFEITNSLIRNKKDLNNIIWKLKVLKFKSLFIKNLKGSKC